jgi:putative ABC transport system permease protein
MKKLFKKLLRDIRRSLGQFCAITIVSAIGVMLLTGMAVVHLGLSSSTNEYYKQSNLADLSAYFLGIDDAGINKIKDIAGVKDAYGRLFLKAENTNNKSSFFVHTVSSDEKINIPVLNKGYIPKTNDECMIDYSYAKENNLSLGDQLKVSINQKNYTFTISGIFNTAEYVYLIEDPTKSLIPDHKIFGLLYVNKSLIKSPVDSNSYNEVLVTLDKSADESLVGKKIESETTNYGFGHITLKKNQLSYSQLQSDIDTADSMSKLFPYIFFLVAAVIIFISMSRTVQSERSQIGVMKALGISSRSITFHYMSYSMASGLIGGLLGNLLGILILPGLMFDTYKMLYTFPHITLTGFWWYIVISVLVVLLFGIAATLFSAARTLKEMPAQCMRPVPPKKVHKTWLEKRTRLWNRISYKNKLIFRNIFLNKWRVVLSSIGVIGCVGLLLCGFGLKEATKAFIDIQFNVIQKFDSMVLISTPVKYEEPVPFTNSNIAVADKMSAIKVTVTARKKISSTLYVLPENNKSIQLFDSNDKNLVLSKEGIVVPYKLALENNIKIGDTVSIKLESVLYGNRNIDVKIASICVQYVSQDFYTSYEYLQKFNIDSYINGYYVTIKDPAHATDTNAYLASVKNVKSIAIKAQLKDQLASVYKIMNTMVYILIVMSGCLALAVIFNISSINIFERRRDIATLKVLGYHKKEINSLVHVENLIITAFGCVIGIFFGAVIYKQVLIVTVSEDIYLPYKITFNMVFLSILLAFAFTVFTNFMLRGKTNKIDMVESLKSVE